MISFCILKAFPGLESLLGLPGFFYASAAAGVVGVIGVALLAPETKGLTITEVIQIFERREESKSDGDVEKKGQENQSYVAE